MRSARLQPLTREISWHQSLFSPLSGIYKATNRCTINSHHPSSGRVTLPKLERFEHTMAGTLCGYQRTVGLNGLNMVGLQKLNFYRHLTRNEFHTRRNCIKKLSLQSNIIQNKDNFPQLFVRSTITSSIRLWSQMSSLKPIVICGPSGSGKSTLLKYLMDEYGDCFGFSVSHTTRKPRPGELNGREYHFVDRKEMEKAIKDGEFIEYTEFSGNLYGTSKKSVQDVQKQGRICILDIEIDGVRNIKKTELNPHYIFIKPPSMKVLEERLRGRGTETEENIQRRLGRAREELTYGEQPGNFDLVLVNDNAEEAYKDLRKFLLRDIEELKTKRADIKGSPAAWLNRKDKPLETLDLHSTIAHHGVLHAGSPCA